MNNLKPQIFEKIVTSDLLLDPRCMTIDTDLNVVYCVNRLNQLICIDVNKLSPKKCCETTPSEDFKVICVEFLSEERSVCMVSNTGHIIVFNTLTQTSETVGTLSVTIESVSFSLDQELIVVLTENCSLILMNKMFDVLAQRELKTQDLGCNPSVSVNWGSKLTQFHGEGKRDVRSQQENFKSFSDFDDKKSRISWRADGLYFMTSYFDTSLNYRKLQIWNREAVLQNTSEPINGLEYPISWKPSGALIASSQMLPNKHMIVFIEKNGLKHGEFELPFPPSTFKLESISWSNDSQILLVLGTNSDFEQILMLWRQTNYQWALKQCLRFKEDFIKIAIWDPIDATLLHIMFSNHQYMRYRWKWSVDASEGCVGVIDGKQLHLTNMEHCVIPPPLFSYSLNFESEIREICFCRTKLAVLLNNDSVFLFERTPQIKSQLKGFSVIFENFNEEKEDIFQCFYSSNCKSISSLTNLMVDRNGLLFGEDSKQLVCFDYQNERVEVVKILALNFNVLAISYLEETLGIVGDDGHLWKVNLKDKTLNQWSDGNGKPVLFPQKCCRIELFKIEDKISSLCLTEYFTLCSDNEILSQNNCNSFVKFKERFLLFTTTDHLMHCWLIDDNIFDVNNNYQNYKPRSVERGSQIITATTDGKVVLQMPRGNLEAVYPRPLLLDLIKVHLDKLEYDYAFDLLRRHRINFNILYDYKPKIFIENIQLFIEKLGNKSIDWICLFLTDLSNQDVYEKITQTDGNKLRKIWSRTICEPTHKVDLICNLMRKTMDRFDSHKYLNPILLTYIKKSESEVGNALNRIKSIDDSLIRDKAIKFLLYSTNINTLVDEALGSYDCDLFLMIASKSQKDPKEYLALIEELNKIESFDYKCYKIDMLLKRYKKALIHISKCEQHFEECLELILSHSLYRDSVVLFDTNSDDKKKIVWKLYAEYLFDKKYFEESAIAFKRSDNLVNAVKAYQLSGNWSAAIECAVLCPLIDVETLARSLAKHLVSIGKHFEASYLLQNYANDINSSITTLIDGHEWEHALRLISTNSSQQLLVYLKKHLLSHCDSIGTLIENNFDILSKHMNRLEIVRQKQSQRNNEFKSFDNFDDKSEIYSETNSWAESKDESKTGSNKSNSSSLVTKRSRKSAKKSEKKKYILKEGSNDEDIQLIYAIKEIIISTDQMQEEVSLLVKTLFNFYYLNESKTIQKTFNELLQLIKDITEEIWSKNQTEETAPKFVITDPELIKGPQVRKIDCKLALI